MSRGLLSRLVVVGLLALTACGKKGPPLAPLRVAPARIEDLSVAKTGDEVRARFTIPAVNADQSKPADIVAVELYAISGKAEDPFGQALGGAQFLRYAQLVGRVEVAPPVKEGEAPPEPGPSAPVAERARSAAEAAAARVGRQLPAQGESATIVEPLTKDDLTPFVYPGRKRTPVVTDVEKGATVPHILGPAPVTEPFSRTYVAVGVSRHGTRASVSNRAAVPIAETPPAPTGVAVTYDATAATINWTEPPGVWRRVQRPAIAGELEARSLAPSVVPTTYNVYRVVRGPGGEQVSPQPINPAPVEVASFTQGAIVLGEEGCYQVRTVRVYGAARLESAPSATACARFVDTFPPPAPANLAAVGSEGGVSLIWDPSAGSDVAGYLVLRGEIGPGGAPATLATLTPEPIRETTYRDATAARGARYVYAVVAVDGATPRNRSEESNRVEEGAR